MCCNCKCSHTELSCDEGTASDADIAMGPPGRAYGGFQNDFVSNRTAGTLIVIIISVRFSFHEAQLKRTLKRRQAFLSEITVKVFLLTVTT